MEETVMRTNEIATGLIRIRTMMPVSRRGLMGGIAAAGALAATGVPVQADNVAVNFVGWQGYDKGLANGGFTEKEGITVNTTYIGNNDEIITKLTAGGVGQIDLVTPYMGYIPLMAKSGLIDPIDESLVPNLAKVIEPFRSDSNLFLDGVRYGVPFTWGSSPIIYDQDVLPKPPEGWQAMLRPEYKGKVGLMDDPLGNIMDAALALGAKPPTKLTREQLDKAIDFLIAMKAQSRLFAASWGELADALARGDVAVTFSGWEAMTKFAADKGKKVSVAYPVEGTHGWLDTYCVAKNAPQREVAHKLANQILSVGAQLEVGDELLQGIVNEDALAKLTTSMAVYSYNDMEAFSKKAGFYSFPPLEAGTEFTTWSDWQDAYQRFRSA